MSKSGMRVIMVLPFVHALSGMEQQAVRLAGALRSRGVDVFFLSSVRWFDFVVFGRRVKFLDEIDGFRVVNIPGLYAFNKVFPSEYALGVIVGLFWFRGKYDVIHAHQLFSAGVSAQLGRLFGRISRPLLVKSAGSGEYGDIADIDANLFSGVKYRLLQDVDGVVAINDEIRDELLEHGFRGEQVLVVPNGIEVGDFEFRTEREYESARSQLGISQDAGYVVANSRLTDQKNIGTMVRVIAGLWDRGVNVRLDVMGALDPAHRTNPYEELANELGIGGQVRFLGRVSMNEVRQRNVAADVFLLTSYSEGISNALLEACAQGVPVVVSENSGNSAVICDGGGMKIADPDDVAGYVDAIVDLLESHDKGKGRALVQRDYVETYFGMGSVVDRYVAWYKEALDEV